VHFSFLVLSLLAITEYIDFRLVPINITDTVRRRQQSEIALADLVG